MADAKIVCRGVWWGASGTGKRTGTVKGAGRRQVRSSVVVKAIVLSAGGGGFLL
ncbi:MAG: hypothetical protein ACO3EZ_15040 [Prochlorotrichaceae cyanobacterium]